MILVIVCFNKKTLIDDQRKRNSSPLVVCISIQELFGKKTQTIDFEMMTSVAFLIHGCDWLFKFQSLGVNSNYKYIKISFYIQ